MIRVDLLTKEYPPEVYGGAGVHAGELARELRQLVDLRVRCFGGPRAETGVTAYAEPRLGGGAPAAALAALGADLPMAADCAGADLVHSHTWYANGAGRLAQLVHGVPHVMTMHSLEPLRPWKAEQLGGGYALSCELERTAVEAADAVIAVSAAMRADILDVYPAVEPGRVHVVHNGIDTERQRPDPRTDALLRHGVDPDRPIALFVGRVTRQKGLELLLRAGFELDPDTQLVLACGQPDTPEIAAETTELVERLRRTRTGVVRIDGMLDPVSLRQLLTHATVFVCPSRYEPLGIVNLEAMACGTAVVATAVGGIPEVVVDGTTGRLVPLDEADEKRTVSELAAAVNALTADPVLARALGAAGRERAAALFSWRQAAARTLEIYQSARSSGGWRK